VFMDTENGIPAGERYPRTIKDALAECKVLLAVIGPKWCEITDETGTRRIDDPKDFVRKEIVACLDGQHRVIPVLVNDAIMPTADQLPDELKPFC
jgi:hypothetical protein